MKKFLVTIATLAILVFGGKFVAVKILDGKLEQGLTFVTAMAAMAGYEGFRFEYRRLFIDFDGAIGFEGLRIGSLNIGFLNIERISYSHGNILNLGRLFWHLKSISQADNVQDRQSRIEEMYASDSLWRHVILRMEGIKPPSVAPEICGATYEGKWLTAPGSVQVSFESSTDDSDLAWDLQGKSPGFIDYTFSLTTPAFSRADQWMASKWPFKLALEGYDNSTISAVLAHCLKHAGNIVEDKRDISKGVGLGIELALAQAGYIVSEGARDGIAQWFTESGDLEFTGSIDIEKQAIKVSTVTLNGEVVASDDAIRPGQRVLPDTANKDSRKSDDSGTKSKGERKSDSVEKGESTSVGRSKWQIKPKSRLADYIGKKVRITTKRGDVREGILESVDPSRYQVVKRVGSGQYGGYAKIEKIMKFEVRRHH